MKSYALVSGGVVVNVGMTSDPPNQEWLDAVATEFDAVVDVTGTATGIGWLYDGTSFTDPTPPPVPEPDPAP